MDNEMNNDDQTWEQDHVPCAPTWAIVPMNVEGPTWPATEAPGEVLLPSIPTSEA